MMWRGTATVGSAAAAAAAINVSTMSVAPVGVAVEVCRRRVVACLRRPGASRSVPSMSRFVRMSFALLQFLLQVRHLFLRFGSLFPYFQLLLVQNVICFLFPPPLFHPPFLLLFPPLPLFFFPFLFFFLPFPLSLSFLFFFSPVVFQPFFFLSFSAILPDLLLCPPFLPLRILSVSPYVKESIMSPLGSVGRFNLFFHANFNFANSLKNFSKY